MVGILCLFGCVTMLFAQQWDQLAGDHFIVYFTGDEKSAGEILSKSEIYYQRVASDLGYSRYSEFWTWDKRVKIYIYPDRDSFLKASHQPRWSEGMSDYKKKEILGYAHSEGFTNGILPHEIAHLIFRDFVGFKGDVPLWLDEGVAQWAEPSKRKIAKDAARDLLIKGALFSVSDMIRLDIRRVAGGDAVNIYYAEATSLVGFLIDQYGAGSFTDFCRQLRDGKSLEESLIFAYPARIKSIDELQNKWLEYLKN